MFGSDGEAGELVGWLDEVASVLFVLEEKKRRTCGMTRDPSDV